MILVFLLFPLYWVLMTSFKTNMEAYRFPPTMIPESPTVQSYISLFTEDNFFFIYYKNNFIVSGVTAAITLVLLDTHFRDLKLPGTAGLSQRFYQHRCSQSSAV